MNNRSETAKSNFINDTSKFVLENTIAVNQHVQSFKSSVSVQATVVNLSAMDKSNRVPLWAAWCTQLHHAAHTHTTYAQAKTRRGMPETKGRDKSNNFPSQFAPALFAWSAQRGTEGGGLSWSLLAPKKYLFAKLKRHPFCRHLWDIFTFKMSSIYLYHFNAQ